MNKEEIKSILYMPIDADYKRLNVGEIVELEKHICSLEYQNEQLNSWLNTHFEVEHCLVDRIKKQQVQLNKIIKYIEEHRAYWEEWHYDGTDIDIESDLNNIYTIAKGGIK